MGNGGSGERKEKLMIIACRLFAQAGYHKTKVSDIVQEAAVAQGTFYWYFKSKEAVAFEIIQQAQNEIIHLISQGYRATPATTQESVLSSEKLFESLFTYARQKPYAIQLILKGIPGEERLMLGIMETRIKIQQEFEKNIKRAMDFQMIPQRDPVLLAAFVTSVLEGLLTRWLFDIEQDQLTIGMRTAQELAKEMVQFEYFGLVGI